MPYGIRFFMREWNRGENGAKSAKNHFLPILILAGKGITFILQIRR